MSSGEAFATFVAVAAAVVAVVMFAATWRVRRAETRPAEDGPLVRQLTDEVRKWRAEAEHWRRTAERLQRELDQRG